MTHHGPINFTARPDDSRIERIEDVPLIGASLGLLLGISLTFVFFVRSGGDPAHRAESGDHER